MMSQPHQTNPTSSPIPPTAPTSNPSSSSSQQEPQEAGVGLQQVSADFRGGEHYSHPHRIHQVQQQQQQQVIAPDGNEEDHGVVDEGVVGDAVVPTSTGDAGSRRASSLSSSPTTIPTTTANSSASLFTSTREGDEHIVPAAGPLRPTQQRGPVQVQVRSEPVVLSPQGPPSRDLPPYLQFPFSHGNDDDPPTLLVMTTIAAAALFRSPTDSVSPVFRPSLMTGGTPNQPRPRTSWELNQ